MGTIFEGDAIVRADRPDQVLSHPEKLCHSRFSVLQFQYDLFAVFVFALLSFPPPPPNDKNTVPSRQLLRKSLKDELLGPPATIIYVILCNPPVVVLLLLCSD